MGFMKSSQVDYFILNKTLLNPVDLKRKRVTHLILWVLRMQIKDIYLAVSYCWMRMGRKALTKHHH